MTTIQYCRMICYTFWVLGYAILYNASLSTVFLISNAFETRSEVSQLKVTLSAGQLAH